MAPRISRDTAAAHGEPLGEEEVRLTKRYYGWPEDAEVPGARRRLRTFRGRNGRARRKGANRQWTKLFEAYRASIRTSPLRSTDAAARTPVWLGSQPAGLSRRSERHRRTRSLGQGAERSRAEHPVVPRRLGGSRALQQDALTSPAPEISKPIPGRQEPAFRYPRARHGRHRERSLAVQAPRPYGATFFIFSDYARPAMRLSALMELPAHLHLHARCDG